MSPESKQKPLPGVAAIGLYMFLLCILGLLGVTQSKLPHFVLLFCVAFAAAGQGLILQRRWGWALALATVLLSSSYQMWRVAAYHELPMLGMAVVNLLLFLYLIRPEVRLRMR